MEQLDKEELRRLPPGSHGIPADVVARNQRERLVAAMAEACAERGYAESSVAGVAKRAGVSSVTFYKQFADNGTACWRRTGSCRGDCSRRSTGLMRRRASSGRARGRRSAPALVLFAADPPSARLLTVEVLAAGPQGVEHHEAMVEALARRLDADWVPVAGMLALIGNLVMAGEAARLPELEEELADTLSLQS